MSDQVERGTVREMVHAIKFRADVLENLLKNPVVGSLEVRTDELAHVRLLERQIYDLHRYLGLIPSAEVTKVTGNQVYLCDSCRYTYPECPDDAKVIFGDGKGHDNICACSKFEVRTGHWINYGSGEWHCSECGDDVLTEGSWKYPESDGYNFCPHCGANMRGE